MDQARHDQGQALGAPAASPASSPHRVRISTEAFAPRDRFDAWREEVALRVARVDVDTPDRTDFFADIDYLDLPRLSVTNLRIAPARLSRSPDLMRDGDDRFVFMLSMNGAARACFKDREIPLACGTGMWTRKDMRGGFLSETPQTSYSLRIDQETMRELTAWPDAVALRRIEPRDPAMGLLRAYVHALMSGETRFDPALLKLADGQLLDLVAHLVNPFGERARADPYGGIKAARFRAVLREIERNAALPELSVEQVARRLGISTRYVQRLLEGAGLSFSTYLREVRLASAHMLLRDPRSAHLRITDICEAAGFGDLSHFNRAFRLRYGCTPTDVRLAK